MTVTAICLNVETARLVFISGIIFGRKKRAHRAAPKGAKRKMGSRDWLWQEDAGMAVYVPLLAVSDC